MKEGGLPTKVPLLTAIAVTMMTRWWCSSLIHQPVQGTCPEPSALTHPSWTRTPQPYSCPKLKTTRENLVHQVHATAPRAPHSCWRSSRVDLDGVDTEASDDSADQCYLIEIAQFLLPSGISVRAAAVLVTAYPWLGTASTIFPTRKPAFIR